MRSLIERYLEVSDTSRWDQDEFYWEQRRWVKQADPLSSILLNIIIQELICQPQHAEVEMRSTVFRCLAYADDPFLFVRRKERADHIFLSRSYEHCLAAISELYKEVG
uniref:Reverse transcriptase domain-containing protein n=1 Tax=Glossina austeni TaxID=7395 RepID=A0A1A9UEF8_GLOAU